MKKHNAIFPAAFAAVLFLSVACQLSAATLQGNPFSPGGTTDFEIVALQGVDSAHPFGTDGFSPQVNTDFEFTPSIGVSWDQGNGKLKDFGLGLYQDSSKNTFSTGLNIKYAQPVDAFSVSITVMDFDIQAGKDTSFKGKKVEPGLLILGANNTIFANLTPTDIFPYLVQHGTSKDVWDLNFGSLLSGLKLADGAITGFILYADMNDSEKASSDPYLLLAVGSGIPSVPEPSTYFSGLAAIGFALLFHFRQRSKKRALAQ